MPPLNPASLEAIHRLRTYVPPPTAYGDVPLSRRAAVLILLYADPHGELRVVITIRAKTLSSYAGEAALPGGRADSLAETPFQTARREAWEEIGLPDIEQPLPQPFRVEHLCELPANLAKTELVVRPCVALLHSFDEATGAQADPEISLIPKLDAREVAVVFTAPFQSFLRLSQTPGEDPGEWYRGSWNVWHNSNWRSMVSNFVFPFLSLLIVPKDEATRGGYDPCQGGNGLVPPFDERHMGEGMEGVGPGRLSDSTWFWLHQFFVQANDQVVRPRRGAPRVPADGQKERYRVFGMTARIIVDAARVAYAREPEFEHNSHFGDEEMIAKLRRLGRLRGRRSPSDELTLETMEKAAKLS
ncbi:hypothetical protein N7532_001918 [Penicillium argentinense]|uniref:Nudix hydrolase domain-containing protein n=1 Tax=Penicillium argentinense TaxID=1131581 RepID=A0A9W9G3J3_9EURO|nr:uncharacterized protein N7532_001918 [Penicillium argentinense]KAJ5111383.1 hypothetical protein N7532_001918 [Penicillium argentinense]